MLKHFVVEESKRLDKLLTEVFPDYSRSYFQFLIEKGAVTSAGRPLKKREIPNRGDPIEVFFITSPEITLEPEAIPLDILYEDEFLICINKPAGMVVHPAPGHLAGTFVNALLHHCHSLPSQDIRPGIVHRLDKETSGVLLAAKTTETHQKLIDMFSERKIEKEYLAITVGNPGIRTIDLPIGRHPAHRKEMTINEKGRSALTHIETIQSKEGFSLVKAKPVTGRTHQIRVHLKAVKTPVLGDRIYGPEKLSNKLKVERQLLHAHHLSFTHPLTGNLLKVTAPIPEDFQKFFKNLD